MWSKHHLCGSRKEESSYLETMNVVCEYGTAEEVKEVIRKKELMSSFLERKETSSRLIADQTERWNRKVGVC